MDGVGGQRVHRAAAAPDRLTAAGETLVTDSGSQNIFMHIPVRGGLIQSTLDL